MPTDSLIRIGQIAYDAAGDDLYMVGIPGFWEIDETTGATTQVGPTGLSTLALAFPPSGDDTLAYTARTQGLPDFLATLDVATGTVVTEVGDLGVIATHGLAFVPEPSGGALLATGCLALVGLGSWRRSRH